jgi:Uncharacterized protein involved in tolerance to divalent cations
VTFLEVRISAPAEHADALAHALVEERLAACCQVLPAIRSTYLWEGAVEFQADEVLLLAKTRRRPLRPPRRARDPAPPYDVPEVVAVPLTHLSSPYAVWLASVLGEPSA